MEHLQNTLADAAPPNPLLNPWLTCQTSLTAKLEQAAGDAQLAVLQQAWKRAGWWEKYALNIDNQQVLQREIVMYAREKACWYARTLIPKVTYDNHADFFDRLDKQILANLIFNNDLINRKEFVNYAVNKNCLEYYWLENSLASESDYLWVRGSQFTISDDSFYLMEILLPGLLEATK